MLPYLKWAEDKICTGQVRSNILACFMLARIIVALGRSLFSHVACLRIPSLPSSKNQVQFDTNNKSKTPNHRAIKLAQDYDNHHPHSTNRTTR